MCTWIIACYYVLGFDALKLIIILDPQGREFINKVIEELFHLTAQTHHNVSSAYHPQTHGLTEWFDQTLQASLIKVVNSSQDDWDEHLTDSHSCSICLSNQHTEGHNAYSF